jgi:adenosylhomocysteine nucleosidase
MKSVNTRLISPCVVFALRRESMYFRRAYPFHRPLPGAPCLAECRQPRGSELHRLSHSVLMLETGVGDAAMTTGLSWCLSPTRFGAWSYRPPFVLSAGFSGALSPEQRVGDLVLATEVLDEQDHRWPAIHTFPSKDPKITLGRILSVRELVSNPQEKQRLGEKYDAVAVDMESAAVARLCQEHNVPFACLRVISDDRNTALSPQLVKLLLRGRVSVPRLTVMLMRHPSLIGELMGLAGKTRKAARQLLAICSLLEGAAIRERDSDKDPARLRQLRTAGSSAR